MATTYAEYQRDRIGWFFGISGGQLIVLAAASLPMLWAINKAAWLSALLLALIWIAVLFVTIVPVRGRSATGWMFACTAYAVGGLLGWTSFRSKASTGQAEDLDTPDLPGVLQGVQVHDGPPLGSNLQRVAIIQDHATKTWAVTAAVVHPGIGMEDADERHRYGEALTGLIDVAGRTEKIEEILFTVRTVPEDGAERALWVSSHRRPNAPALSERVNGDLAHGLTQASVRTEQFVTIVVPETRIAKAAKESGGGLEGRCRELYLLMAEIEAQLRGPMRTTTVNWLTSPELALACRTGFAPGDRAGIVEALAMREKDSGVNAEVPWAMAGPSGADSVVRHYSHDAWNSVSSTIKLPARGVVMGALAPVLTPSESGERRSFAVAYPIVPQSKADRQSGNAEWAADLAEGMRSKVGMKIRAKQAEDAAKARGLDQKLARGNYLTRPYAVCTVTVPKTARISEFGRRLDASVRRAGFAPLRLDLSQDAGFAASTIPLGISLTRKGNA
ncbi:PrgI family protein [Nocardioides immobilis]|uniref:PrgI family protein n=1 Tax=Nocardioides immobilis TaxID=2049295 RepID=A0A417Y6U6_9ACTN|nr:SCO6880 family protein [Nocardioides immobilis]RHW28297.1 PrgI family protein [Nocardioides immobilis]